MLFAAGFGTRMKGLTADRPKPLIEVDGKPLIDHALDLTKAISPDKIVANLHYKPQMLADHLMPKGVQLSYETDEILETGGGLRQALDLLGKGPVFTMNTDAIWTGPNPLMTLLDQWNPDTMDALLMCVPKSQTVGYEGAGNFVPDAQGRLNRGDGLIYGGVQILKTDQLAGVTDNSFSLNVIWDQMIDQGRLFGATHSGQWCDVGRPEGIGLAEDLIRSAHV
jgi:MurNAc alpha-1-phosphate uridylyltransferase